MYPRIGKECVTLLDLHTDFGCVTGVGGEWETRKLLIWGLFLLGPRVIWPASLLLMPQLFSFCCWQMRRTNFVGYTAGRTTPSLVGALVGALVGFAATTLDHLHVLMTHTAAMRHNRCRPLHSSVAHHMVQCLLLFSCWDGRMIIVGAMLVTLR